MRFAVATAVVLLLVLGLSGPIVGQSRPDLYFGFTRLDPTSESVTPNAWLIVTDGRISKVGSGTPPAGSKYVRHDLSGRFALPGFVDAHAHITAGPHALTMVDGKPLVTIESVDSITRFNARMALAFGVTSVRNPGDDPEANARYDARVKSGDWIGPDAVHAGAVIQPPPFGGHAFAYPRTDAEWDAEAARQAKLGMRWFKLYVSLTEEEVAKGIAAAHRHGLRAMAHLNQVSWARAAELGIDDLTHALPTSADLLESGARERFLAEADATSRYMYRWFELVDWNAPKASGLIETLAKRQIGVDLTMVVNWGVYNADRADSLNPKELERYVHPATLAASRKFAARSAAGWTPEDYQRARAVMAKVFEMARRFDQAGVPLMIGTDGHGGGPIYAKELELHAEAGIPIWEVLRLATTLGAERIGLGARTGRLAPGYEADIVFLRGNPLDDLARAREVDLVVSNGKAFRFEELTTP
jgi:imidazolonepropionase-like amidohydrolase